MHRKLIEQAFEKVKQELGSDKLTHLAKRLSDFIFEDSGEPYGERILRDNINKIKKDSEEKITIRTFAAESLSHYLGYTSFSKFLEENPSNTLKKTNKKNNFFKKHKVTIIASTIIIIGFLIYNSATKQRWMVWQEDHYVEVDFDLEKYSLNELKVYNQDRIDNFRKVIPDCNYPFFRENGNVNLWYLKKQNKGIDCFTTSGKHPTIGRDLKPITKYMIEKYICMK